MTISSKVLSLGLVGAMSLATFGVASARPAHTGTYRAAKAYHGHHRYYSRGPGAGGLVAGAALGLIGAGIAGAAASNYGYGGYGYAPAYGYGYGAPAYNYAPAYGYVAPGYGYYGGY